jgi:hypothetical membrane protein
MLTLVPLGMYPEMVEPNHMIVLFLVFGGSFMLISIVATLIYIPRKAAFFPYQHSLLLAFLMIAIMIGVRQSLKM